MGVITIICDVCGIEMDTSVANYDVGSEQYLCREHYRQRRLDDAKAERAKLAAWLDATHLKRLREIDAKIAILETHNTDAAILARERVEPTVPATMYLALTDAMGYDAGEQLLSPEEFATNLANSNSKCKTGCVC